MEGMEFLIIAAFAFLYAGLLIVLARRHGGWVEMNRSRRGIPAPRCETAYQELPTMMRSWVFTIPALAALGLACAIAGIAIVVVS